MAAPIILYTDILYGPKSGAPGGGGCFLSIFGKNFGAVLGNVSVTVGGGAATPMFLGSSYGRLDVQWLAVQLETACATGAVVVTVSGVGSNTNHSFTVIAGAITYYSAIPTEGQIAAMSPGDVAVVRAGTYDAEIYFHTVSGSSGLPLTVMGYPGEAVLIRRNGANENAVHTFYSGADGTQGFYQISNLDCDMGWDGTDPGAVSFGASVIGMGVDLQDVRVVNCITSGMYEEAGGSAAISGSGQLLKVLGCYVHDNGGSKLYHGLYFDARAATPGNYELAWNEICRQSGGRGIQVFGDAASANITNVSVHHNRIYNIHLDGILFGDKSTTGFSCYNNIVSRCSNAAYVGFSTDAGSGGSGLRFNNAGLVVQAYHNTFFDTAMDNGADSTALIVQAVSDGGIDLVNNIFHTNGLQTYTTGTTAGKFASCTKNLWYGSGTAPSFDTSPVNSDPIFVDSAAGDLGIQTSSPAKDAGSAALAAADDHYGTTRPINTTQDIGAHEFGAAAASTNTRSVIFLG